MKKIKLNNFEVKKNSNKELINDFKQGLKELKEGKLIKC